MKSTRLGQALAVACLIASGSAFAEMEHRMGGLPGMPAHMLKPGAEFEHHRQYHPDATQPDADMMFTFGQPGDPRAVDRTVRIEARGNRFATAALAFATGETVAFEFRNMDSQPHELRIGDVRYQHEHAEMLKRMPGWAHSSPNSILVAPGEVGTLIWRFGDDAEVELACHLGANYQAGMVARAKVTR